MMLSTAALKIQKTIIFDSFFRLIEDLKKRKHPFTIILRTFGPDAPKIADVLHRESGCKITEFHTVTKGVFKIGDKERICINIFYGRPIMLPFAMIIHGGLNMMKKDNLAKIFLSI